MENAIKPVVDDVLKHKSNSELKHIVYLLGVIIVVLAGYLLTIKVTTNLNKSKSIEENISKVSSQINELGKVVVTGFTNLNNKTDSMILTNEMQHKGINKKMEILKETQDYNTRKQFDLIDDLINMNELKSMGGGYIPPTINEAEILNSIELKYDQNNVLTNEIYNELAKKPYSP